MSDRLPTPFRATGESVAAEPAASGDAILVVEDDEDSGDILAAALARQGYATEVVPDAARARARLARGDVDLVVLDVRLPGESGLDLCASIREAGPLPVIMVSGADTLSDRIAGFDAGADDYVVKPVYPAELVRRVDAVLRRVRPAPNALIPGPGGMRLDVAASEAVLGERRARLTRSEVGLLRILLEHPGVALSSRDLCREVWEYEAVGDSNFIQQHVSRLRRKLRALGLQGEVIRTVYGVGYVVDPSSPGDPP